MSIDRNAICRADVNFPGMSFSLIESQLTHIWQRLLKLPSIGPNDNLLLLGADESSGDSFVQEVNRLYNYNLPLHAVFEFPTISQITALIAERNVIDDESPLVPIQPNGSMPPLFLVHSIGGSPFWGYTDIARHLSPNQPVYGLRYTQQQTLEDCSDISKMASHYVNQILAFDAQGPYALGGYCFGGNIAYEMARILEKRGRQVRLLVLLNSSPPNSGYEVMRWTFKTVYLFLSNLGQWLSLFLSWEPELKRQYLRWKVRNFLTKTKKFLGVIRQNKETCDDLIDLTLFPEDKRALVKAHVQAQLAYIPQPYAGQVTLIRTSTHDVFCSFDPNFGWKELAIGGVTTHVIRGTHENIMLEPFVQSLAKVVQMCLERSS